MSDDFILSWHGIVGIDRYGTSVHSHNNVLKVIIEDDIWEA